MNTDNRVLFFGALAVLGAVLASGTGLLSFSGSEPPRYGECYFDESTGDILRQECRDVHEGKIPSNELIGYSNGERESESFRVRIEGIGVDVNEDDPEEKAPQFWWLYSNDYTNSETEEQIEEGDFPDDVDLPRDLVWNDQIMERLERGSTCTGTFQVESTGEVNIETTVSSQSYNDEPDEDELYVDRIMDRTTVDGEVVEINEDYLECEFDFTELMNKGLDLPGKFVSWDGREPYVGGDDSDEGYGAVSVEFRESVDSDGDGVVDRNDECPNELGEKANGCPKVFDRDGDGVPNTADVCPDEAGELENGCVNTPPTVSIDAPDRVEDEAEFTVTASATDPDGQGLSYEWSNGETGRSATYSFARSGVDRELSVTVSDGLGSVSESATVEVVDGSTSPPEGSDGRDGGSEQGGLVSVLLDLLSVLPLVRVG